ncbi:SpoIIE family protein phosphatase [Dactylosporangium sp. AC04546]|uniref:SpoIIE family protein phosphatase n=1 Tax=Dactylosporangium sp. AC04546 TaxID=2862460 RepID=UPI001EDFB694|nr:SpoIIE family protein phosphatase [Dactylosporangium sp. AC04546]WVK88514.1 SpoIIE family protein phosphatase [Dactylosporangium sp. AC04546]
MGGPLPEESAEELYENAPCGYLSLLPDGTVVRANRTFLGWTGQRREELIGRRIQELYAVGTRVYHETHLLPLLHMQGEVREIAAEFRRADGGRLHAFVNAMLRTDPVTGTSVIRMTVVDATDRRTYERELLEARRRAERNEARIKVLQDMVAECAAIERAEQIVAPIVHAGRAAFEAAETTVWLITPGEAVLRRSGEGEPARLSLDDAAPEARSAALGDVVRQEGNSKRFPLLVVVPLVTDRQVLGVVTFAFAADRPIAADEVELMRTVGRQAGQALDRAYLHEETVRRAWQAGFLAGLSRSLDETNGLAERAQRLVDLLVPELARYAQVDLDLAGEPGVQVAGPGDGSAPWAIPHDVLMAVQAMGRTGGPVAPVPLLPPDGRRAVVLPLRARNAVLGTLLLVSSPVTDAVGPDFLVDLADRAGMTLDNARLAERDREVAHTMQQSLLTHDWPTDARFRVATVYRPAVQSLEVGGDWYDIFTISPERVGIVVGDVVGRGLHAASTMGQLRSAVRALASTQGGPAEVLRHMDEFVTTFEGGEMTTLAYAELALDTGVLRYSCAGHPPPLLLQPGEEPVFLWDARSGPIGTAAARRERTEAAFTVPRGSRLLLYTDGLIERRGESILDGLDRLAALVGERRDAALEELTEQVSDALVPSEGGHDDMCLLAVEFHDAPRFGADVPARMPALSGMRGDLDQWLAGQGVEEYERFRIVLAASEAVANAIAHAYDNDPTRHVAVTASVDAGTVTVRVADTGRWRPPRTTTERGHGMVLIGRMMDELVIDRGAGGTTVLMRRRIGGMS